MSTPLEQRRAFLRLPLGVAMLLALPGSAFAQPSAGAALRTVRLTVAGHPSLAENVIWQKQPQQDGAIVIGLESDLYAIIAGDPKAVLLLDVEATQPGARVSVRQRSVSFLNLSEEGPHIDVPGADVRSGWTVLGAAAAGRFRVLETVDQPVKLDRRHLARVLASEPSWLKLAQACRGPNEGACYTVTDPEFEITVTAADGRTTRSIVRVFKPTGC